MNVVNGSITNTKTFHKLRGSVRYVIYNAPNWSRAFVAVEVGKLFLGERLASVNGIPTENINGCSVQTARNVHDLERTVWILILYTLEDKVHIRYPRHYKRDEWFTE